mmetsp:Transcript_9005/g.15672  ORF Transcript_9005/g.15672 Transcript_9005/m.15672 type:complete len:519 (+) Transcript_9005:81-1637(+)
MLKGFHGESHGGGGVNARQNQAQKWIDSYWALVPRLAKYKPFLLKLLGTDKDFPRILKFWLSPTIIDYTRCWKAEGLCGILLSLASNYLKLKRYDEARGLTINGAFLLQCTFTPIESILKTCKEVFKCEDELPFLYKGIRAVSTGYVGAYIRETLMSVKPKMEHLKMNEWCQLGNDFSHASKSSQRAPSQVSAGKEIKLIIVDGSHEDERHSVNIGSSTTLKTLFNDYAEKRGVSLRSLRFSYAGKTLFLSSVSNKTPEELNMHDQDVIYAHNTNAFQESSGTSPSACQGASRKKYKQKKKMPHENCETNKISKNVRKGKCRGKGEGEKKQQPKQNEPTKTLEEYKAEHSIVLSKLHEEVQHQLKEIRMRLNALDIHRQPPKQKKRNSINKKRKNKEDIPTQQIPSPAIDGKAGKAFYNIKVGDSQNLYRSCKSSQKIPCRDLPTLDLHGCTREEALIKLDKILEAWVDTAMHGPYPFVIPGKIVCGCGNQILSEIVEEWIRNNDQVANAPRNFMYEK